MAAIFGPGGPIILPWTVRGDRFSGGTVHGVTFLHFHDHHVIHNLVLASVDQFFATVY